MPNPITYRRALLNPISPYIANAVDFDGSNDDTQRGAQLTGISDGKTGTLSTWFRVDDETSSSKVFLGVNRAYELNLNTASLAQVRAENAAGTQILLISSSIGPDVGTWAHFLASWDLANGVTNLFLDDVDREGGGTVATDDDIDYTVTETTMGDNGSGTARFNGCLADFWFSTEFVDITVKANRLLFRSSTGLPVGLGITGSKPTGTAPVVFFKNPAASVGVNSGTGGNFTIAGAPAVCSDGPSD